MLQPSHLEKLYQKFTTNLSKYLPDGMIFVDSELLHEIGEPLEEEDQSTSEEFPHYFHIIETDEKVTLFNQQFAIWIVPQIVNDMPSTLTFIARTSNKHPKLELMFCTTGVYNTPKYVLKVLRYFLSEVLDTEEVISSIKKS